MIGLDEFVEMLAHFSTENDEVWNPWAVNTNANINDHDGPQKRRMRLKAHLDIEPRWILMGESPSVGCQATGIAMTDETNVTAGRVPRVDKTRITNEAKPKAERTATAVWDTLHRLNIAQHAVLWNACPMLPYKSIKDGWVSPRKPAADEVNQTLQMTKSFLDLFNDVPIIAVGRTAESTLKELGKTSHYVRHPSMAGAVTFAQMMDDLVSVDSRHAPE